MDCICKKNTTFLMNEVCFFFLADTESLCGLRFQVQSGLVRHGGLEPGETGNLEEKPFI